MIFCLGNRDWELNILSRGNFGDWRMFESAREEQLTDFKGRKCQESKDYRENIESVPFIV